MTPPTLGRTVWFRASDGRDRAAILTGIGRSTDVTLSVLGVEDDDVAVQRHTNVPFYEHEAAEDAVGVPSPSWRWPVMV